jgi:hypothetical protein
MHRIDGHIRRAHLTLLAKGSPPPLPNAEVHSTIRPTAPPPPLPTAEEPLAATPAALAAMVRRESSTSPPIQQKTAPALFSPRAPQQPVEAASAAARTDGPTLTSRPGSAYGGGERSGAGAKVSFAAQRQSTSARGLTITSAADAAASDEAIRRGRAREGGGYDDASPSSAASATPRDAQLYAAGATDEWRSSHGKWEAAARLVHTHNVVRETLHAQVILNP